MYSLRILISQPSRTILTILGISLCLILMLFLFGIYRGVADGSVDYVRKNDVDLWIIQESSTNILRGTSFLPAYIENTIKNNGRVESVTPVLLLLTTVKAGNNFATLFLAGYPPESKYGGPPSIISGRKVHNDDELVLDKAFAAKMGLNIGDTVEVQDKSLVIAGLSSGTNAFVIQYGFTSLECAENLLGFKGIVTCYLVKLVKNSSVAVELNKIRNSLNGVVVFDHETFIRNNERETESGILPIFYAVAGLGGVVLTIILSLILSINILEKRNDLAVMKAIGAPGKFLPGMIISQSLLISFVSVIISIILFFPLSDLIEFLSPEITTKTTFSQLIVVACLLCTMSLTSSFISIRRLKTIYPLEVFQ